MIVRVAAVLSMACVAPALAQQDALENIEHLVAVGRLTEARSTLDRWNRVTGSRMAGNAKARALLLEARLAVDPAAAEAAYQAIALSYPTSPQAPEALLRSGQGMVTAAELGTRRDAAARAVRLLERLIADYPRSPHRDSGRLWLVRAHVLAGSKERACTVARHALDAGVGDEDVAHMLRVEFSSHCDV
jgi:hypothetical protein